MALSQLIRARRWVSVLLPLFRPVTLMLCPLNSRRFRCLYQICRYPMLMQLQSPLKTHSRSLALRRRLLSLLEWVRPLSHQSKGLLKRQMVPLQTDNSEGSTSIVSTHLKISVAIRIPTQQLSMWRKRNESSRKSRRKSSAQRHTRSTFCSASKTSAVLVLITWPYLCCPIRSVSLKWTQPRYSELKKKRTTSSPLKSASFVFSWTRSRRKTSTKSSISSWMTLITTPRYFKSWWRSSSWKAQLRLPSLIFTSSFALAFSRSLTTRSTQRWILKSYYSLAASVNFIKCSNVSRTTGARGVPPWRRIWSKMTSSKTSTSRCSLCLTRTSWRGSSRTKCMAICAWSSSSSTSTWSMVTLSRLA